jgi:hypothetical protein
MSTLKVCVAMLVFLGAAGLAHAGPLKQGVTKTLQSYSEPRGVFIVAKRPLLGIFELKLNPAQAATRLAGNKQVKLIQKERGNNYIFGTFLSPTRTLDKTTVSSEAAFKQWVQTHNMVFYPN